MNGLGSLALPDTNFCRLLRASARPRGPGRRQAVVDCAAQDLGASSQSSSSARAPVARDLLMRIHQEHVAALLVAGRAISSQINDAWQAVAARLGPLKGAGRWRLPLAPPAFWPQLAAPVSETAPSGLLSYAAAAALVLMDGQVAAAVPPLPAVTQVDPTLLPFLVPADQVEVSHAALMADLSNMAYGVTDVTASRLETMHNLQLVSTSTTCLLRKPMPSTHHRHHHHHHATGSPGHGGGFDAVVVAAAAAGVAAAAAASDAPPPVMLLPVEAAEATAAAASASPPSSPLSHSPRSSQSCSSSDPASHVELGSEGSPRSPSPVSFFDLSSPKAAVTTLSGAEARSVFLTDDDFGSMATYSEEWDDRVLHRVPAADHYLASAHMHVATQLPQAPGQTQLAQPPPPPPQEQQATLAAATTDVAAALDGNIPAAVQPSSSSMSGPSTEVHGGSTSGSSVTANVQLGGGNGAASPSTPAQAPLDALSMCDPDPPTAWFACDNPTTQNRHFVLQGSTSWEHWQINVQFDPAVFEDPALGVRIHRGVYETACILYDDLLPLVREHIATSPFATVSFTGHSLGGSLATVIMLLFVSRGEIMPQSVAAVYTFGAPAVFCQEAVGDDADPSAPTGRCSACKLTCELSGQAFGGGTVNSYNGGALASPGRSSSGAGPGPDAYACPRATGLLKALKLTEEHIVNVIMHKDIVPRAFVCDYNMVADLLKRWWPSFKDHSTLQEGEHQSLYSFIGRVAVLQPTEDSPFVVRDGHHEMLPRRPAMYKLYERPPVGHSRHEHHRQTYQQYMSGTAPHTPPAPAENAPGTLKEALTAFMNSPHPLTVLADYKAYGANGSISRYHNPDNYTKALVSLLC